LAGRAALVKLGAAAEMSQDQFGNGSVPNRPSTAPDGTVARHPDTQKLENAQSAWLCDRAAFGQKMTGSQRQA